MRKLLLMSFVMVLTLLQQAYAQNKTVSGTVTDQSTGQRLPGVTVLVKGTNVGTATGVDGTYTINVPAGGTTLEFRFVGYAALERPIGNSATINVALGTDVRQLNEVVVTALGVARQEKSLGYAVGQVKAEELSQAKAVNAAQSLSGKVAGLQISTIANGVSPTTRISLRGNRSLLGNNQALVVIDGVQSPQSALDYLNPNDIASVSVLKGANAAALYGSDASNGALIVTTKKGTKGSAKITYSNTSSIEQVSFLPEFQERFGAGTEHYSRIYIPFENQQYGPEFDGSMREVGRTLEDGSIQMLPYKALDNERYKVWNTGKTIQNDISLSSGGDFSTFYISLQDVKTEGVVPKDEYRRTGGRFNGTGEYGKFKASYNINYAQTRTQRTTADFYNLTLQTAANIPLTDYKNWQGIYNADGSINYANPNNFYNEYYQSPWFALDNNREDIGKTNLNANAQLGLQATNWLNLTYRVGVNNEETSRKAYVGKYTYSDYSKNVIKKYIAKDVAGSVRDYTISNRRIVTDLFATLNHKFGDFEATAIFGNNIREDKYKYLNMQSSALVQPDVYNVSNRTGEATVVQTDRLQRLIGWYGDITIGFRDYLFLHASGRNDQTSLLNADNRSFFYPGVDIAFNASDVIPALQNSVVDFLKFTGAVTKVGNVNVDPYALDLTFDTSGGFPYGNTAGFTIGSTTPDQNLQPEFTTSYEVGAQTSFLRGRIGLEAAVYKQNSTNQTVTISISSATGFSSALINAGETENSGYELSLNTTPIRTASGFRMDVNVNYSNTDTKVVELFQGLDEVNLSSYAGLTTSTGSGIYARVGEQYPVIKVSNYARDPQGRVIVDATTGYPKNNPDGLIVAGQTNPRHKLGISTNMSYKGLALSALAEYRGGNVIYHDLGNTMVFTGTAKITEMYGRERFVFPNSVIDNGDGTYTPNTSVTVADGGVGFWDSNFKQYGENFVTSGAFWKLREVALTYQIPQNILAPTKYVKNVSVGFVGRNLLTLLPKENMYTDPEFSQTTGNAFGINTTGNTPPTRTYGVNLTATF
ncbi:SusC/RagA family TonB-linked outer membrane protein [Pontibacter oryzae]|uniref:SusC/RagA family TonB-linked outer membrane protein n=1 Tax=Pontibacter oryzae TaxID=2304593 RepID=A0A399S2S3_9BACT|nr:SusC/RagA family TonB-linked outer membrane protein [Pontibacter oryzae]RIJ37004.1 SusC/RagA family TonB-linked outer membrane protein [Pontibacter oryzae]